jgi:hypothetical protein
MMKAALLMLGSASETQIDPIATARLRTLAEQPVVRSDELLAIIDDCVYASWASGFAISAMNVIWMQMLDAEGQTVEQALANRDASLRQSKI